MRSRGTAAGLAATLAGVAGIAVGLALAPRGEEPPPAEAAAPRTAVGAAPPAERTRSSVEGAPPATAEPRPLPRGPLPEPYGARLDSASLDLDGDGAEDLVELSAAVERDSRGRLMWDDGQRWMLRVVAGDGAGGWVLFDDYVQLGRLSFWAVTSVDEPPVLVLELATGAGVRVWSVAFDARRASLVEGEAVAASGNVVHRTPAELE